MPDDPNHKLRDQVIKDFNANKSGVVKYHSSKRGTLYISYQPLSINNWYLISVVPEKHITAITNTFIALLPMLCVMIALAALMLGYGYEKDTNPLLSQDNVTALDAKAAATYTTAGVKAILDHKPSGKLYEILPNYLYRSGVDVIWRTNNWGEPPVHIEKFMKAKKLKEMYPDADDRYDGILLAGLKEQIMESTAEKIFIVLHTSTSHGPTYNKKYPAEFEKFTPVCTTVEMSKADPVELMNAYDNTIVYTDYLIHSVIEILKEMTDRRSCMLYVSDHGESLGEGNLYMHGVPMSVAPAEQIEIPFIVWTSEDGRNIKDIEEASQYHVFHSVLDHLGVSSPIFDKSKSIFE